MARWATTIVVAGVVFTGCRGEIVGAEKFKNQYRGSVEWCASGRPDVQHVNVSGKGLQFGLNMLSVELAKFNAALAAISTAQASNSTFAVNLVDEAYTINVNAVPDYTQNWNQHGVPAQGYVPNVVWRFISYSLV